MLEHFCSAHLCKEVYMSDNQTGNSQARNTSNTIWQIVGRMITAGIILAITAFFTPGFQISNFWALAIATVVLSVMDFLIAKFTGLKVSPFGKGFVGFILSAVVLYVTQFFVAGYVISWMAAIIGALIYGVVDYFLPGDEQLF